MRVAVVGFCLNHPTGRRNLQALEVLANKYKVFVDVFTVDRWGEFDDKGLLKKQTKFLHIHKLPTLFFSREPSQYKYHLRGLIPEIKRLRPEVVYVENESVALDTFIGYKAAKKSGAAFGFFSWENIYKDWFFPLNLVEKWITRGCDFMVAGTEDVKRIYVKKGMHPGKVSVIPQAGVDVSLFKPSTKNACKKLGIRKEGTVLFVGRLLEMKGIRTILKAKSILDKKGRKYSYLFVGSGEMSKELKSIGERVHVIDWLATEELPKIYNSASVFLYPSIPTDYWIEQFGFAMVEALSCEVPVIASDVSGPRAIVDNGKDGFLIKVGDEKELAKRIELLMENKKKRIKFGKHGRKQAIKGFSNEVVAKQLYELFKKIK